MPESGSDTFESLCDEGRQLLHTAHNPLNAQRDFEIWDRHLAKWLDRHFADAGLSAQWSSLSASKLVCGGGIYDNHKSWSEFQSAVLKRLEWLGQLGLSMQSSGRDSRSGQGKSPVPSNRVF